MGFLSRTTPLPPLLTVRLGKGLIGDLEMDAILRDVQAKCFHQVGLIIPIPVIREERGLRNRYQLQINDRKSEPTEFDQETFDQTLVAQLAERAAELLTPDLVDYYLGKLAEQFPILVET